MNFNVHLLVFGIVFASVPSIEISTANADTNITQFLNDKLAALPAVVVETTKTTGHRVCDPGVNGRGGYSTEAVVVRNKVSSSSTADEQPQMYRYCEIVYTETKVHTPEKAHIIAEQVVNVSNLAWLKEQTVSLPGGIMRGSTSIYSNCGSTADIETIAFSESVSEGWTIGLSNTVTNGNSQSVNASFSYMGATLGTNFSFNHSVNTSRSESQSESTSAARSVSYSLSIPPHKQGSLALWITQSTIEIPFTATVLVDGPIQANVSGVSKASDLLSIADRTVAFTGSLRITGVSGIRSRKSESDLSECAEQPNVLTTKFELPFDPNNPLNKEAKSLEQLMGATTQEATIGPADGTSYQVLATTPVYLTDAQCGFNDLGIPKLAKYNQELRLWSTYVKGNKVAEWTTNEQLFVECSPDP